jgi:hypothetical protein
MLNLLIYIFWGYLCTGFSFTFFALLNGTLQETAAREGVKPWIGAIITILFWPAVVYGMIKEFGRRF